MPAPHRPFFSDKFFKEKTLSLLRRRISPLSACDFWALPDAAGRDISSQEVLQRT